MHTLKHAIRGMDVSLIKSLKLLSIGQQRHTGTGGAAFALLVNNRALHLITQGLHHLGEPTPPLALLAAPSPHLSLLASSLSRCLRLHSTASLGNLYI